MNKSAIDAFALALAAELGRRGTTVNTLPPGLTATEMNARLRANLKAESAFSSTTALGRINTVEGLADAVSLLALPDARWIPVSTSRQARDWGW